MNTIAPWCIVTLCLSFGNVFAVVFIYREALCDFCIYEKCNINFFLKIESRTLSWCELQRNYFPLHEV